MRIALINPKGTIFSKNKRLSEFLKNSVSMGSFRHFWSAPCLGLLTIASYIPVDWEISYIDENLRRMDDTVDYDMVCISMMTVQAERAYEIGDSYRARGILTVMGGIHATLMYQEVLEHSDVVLAGEGEVLFPAFINDFLAGTHKRLYRENTPGGFELKNCIPPRYDLLKGYDYPVINLYTTRGCPRKCNFCCASNVYGERYRRKENQEIFKEVSVISQMYPDRMLLFADDNLLIMRKESREMLQGLEKYDIRWIAQTDIAIAEDERLLRQMKQSGCQWVVIGFESLSEKNLRNLDSFGFKHKYLNEYRARVGKIQNAGIKVYGTFIVGLDGDTESIFEKTVNFIQDCNLYGVNITVPTPLPGTQMRRQLEQEGRIISNRWGDYTLWDVVIQPKSFSVSELEEGLFSMYERLNKESSVEQRLRQIWCELKAERQKNRISGERIKC